MSNLTSMEDAGNAAIDIEDLIIYQLQTKYDIEVDLESEEWIKGFSGMWDFIEAQFVTGNYRR